MKLIIIGNGFDLDHKIKTGWSTIFTKEALAEISSMSEKMKLFEDHPRKELWNNFEEIIGKNVDAYRSIFTEEADMLTPAKVVDSIHGCYWRWKEDILKTTTKEDIMLLDLNMELYEKMEDHINEFFNDFPIKDKSQIVINKLMTGIQGAVTEYKENVKEGTIPCHYEKYDEFFEGEKVIINYNYTQVHETYFSNEECFHIHGVINEETAALIPGGDWQPGQNQTPQLGKYKFKANREAKIHKDFDNELDRMLVNFFERYLGNTNTFFNKAGSISHSTNEEYNKVWLEKLKDIKYDEIVVLGHSLFDDDIVPLVKQYKENISDIKKISFVTFLGEDSDQAWIEQKNVVYKHFGTHPLTILDNNSGKSKTFDK